MNAEIQEIPSYKESLKLLREQLGGMLPAEKLAIFDTDATDLGKRQVAPLKIHVGDKAPLFGLPNPQGESIKLADLLQQGSVVLTFYRGVWCPYCNLEIKNLQAILPHIKAAGANLVAISPMTPDFSKNMQEQNALDFHVLSDVDNAVSRQYTSVFQNPESSIKAMADLGYDFYSFYDSHSGELAVPATFIIRQSGEVLFARSAGGDYRQRIEPQEILDALESNLNSK